MVKSKNNTSHVGLSRSLITTFVGVLLISGALALVMEGFRLGQTLINVGARGLAPTYIVLALIPFVLFAVALALHPRGRGRLNWLAESLVASIIGLALYGALMQLVNELPMALGIDLMSINFTALNFGLGGGVLAVFVIGMIAWRRSAR